MNEGSDDVAAVRRQCRHGNAQPPHSHCKYCMARVSGFHPSPAARLPPLRTGFNPRPVHSGLWQVGIAPDEDGFSRGSPVSPPLHSVAAPYSPHFTFTGSQDLEVAHSLLMTCMKLFWLAITMSWESVRMKRNERAGDPLGNPPTSKFPCAKILERPRRPLGSQQGKPGSIPGRATPGFSQVRIVPDDASGRRGLLEDLPLPPPLRSGAAPFSPHFNLIGYQDHVVKSRSNL
ncbi:hypothetical protein PR048_003525 [Dryococelus australis]|uniref:Uncharacterized protein n=1 Tax=Dryococelus australis TaxID=614101 RepID=A0ABQ9IPP6_9NEOP|nr:hypothetical protein PR048_003525 [Dryococelus australis]